MEPDRAAQDTLVGGSCLEKAQVGYFGAVLRDI